MDELKPCPFCGATNTKDGEILRYATTEYWAHWKNGCILGGLIIKDIEAWNRRANDDFDSIR